jgi:hypothetical protein
MMEANCAEETFPPHPGSGHLLHGGEGRDEGALAVRLAFQSRFSARQIEL